METPLKFKCVDHLVMAVEPKIRGVTDMLVRNCPQQYDPYGTGNDCGLFAAKFLCRYAEL